MQSKSAADYGGRADSDDCRSCNASSLLRGHSSAGGKGQRRAPIKSGLTGIDALDIKHLDADTSFMARLELTPEATRHAERLPKAIHNRVLALLERLQSWPAITVFASEW